MEEEFLSFKNFLQEDQDKREKIIRLSREITIQSKRMIFLLHQTSSSDGFPLPKDFDRTSIFEKKIHKELESLKRELAGLNADKFSSACTHGLQEYVEAVTFKFWLQTGTLLSCKDSSFRISINFIDYVLGVCDMTGEIMRFLVTNGSKFSVQQLTQQVKFLRGLHKNCSEIEHLPSKVKSELQQKLSVMENSISKVEGICYSKILREADKRYLNLEVDTATPPEEKRLRST
ncbi:TRAX protein [Schizosaccharomyces pombe]|uniref:Translin-associated protein X homolog n=1 Tax=Schizosaccharomyces pombe (strain 972 / ATCC 24843) TaxID=284812 RepID=TSNAX_SCHPO|nr:translin family protein [Schizosaccharomyces pombe]O74955.1 RecName: Full=Translin-associated protein X homolog [Schizosaccharomyces pombe 972h-]CAA19273.1 TRAX [Schizosaccharomyces pombe]|eukprot:NP_587780.1 translin family protein [Schizosaccharomyces pombe]